MVRALRGLILAVLVVTSLLLSASVASAHSGRHHHVKAPAVPAAPALFRDITWE